MQQAFAAYSESLGKTVANLQSLEFLLRLFLHNSQVEPMWLEKAPVSMQIGDVVTETPLTDWSSLAVLIDRYKRGGQRPAGAEGGKIGCGSPGRACARQNVHA